MNRLKEFKKGHKKFKKMDFKKNKKRFKKLVREGQRPTTLFISCSDSRVVPNLITQSGIGKLFIVRNIGNFVPPFSSNEQCHSHCKAAVEYAVNHLEVSDIIVCGHSDCGAIKELFLQNKNKRDSKKSPNVSKWLELGKNVKKKTLKTVGKKSFKKQRDFAEKLSVIMQLENLLTYPNVKEKVKKGTLFLHAWHYDIESGDVEYFDNKIKGYRPLKEA